MDSLGTRLLSGWRLSIPTSLALVSLPTSALADVELAPIVVIDFQEFDGSGFHPDPGPGQLDSDDWSITLGPDGYGFDFGEIAEDPATAFARGLSPGSTDDSGIFAFEVDGAGLIALGVQPAGETFTPGRIALRLVNDTGADVTAIQVEYNLWVNNDLPRANSFDLEQSSDNVTYTQVGAGFTTPGPEDANGFVVTDIVEVVTPAAAIGDGEQYYLSWAGDDVIEAPGSRDEIGIEGITIRVLGVCGNGLTEKDEECDDGFDNADSAACTAACVAAVCGDGLVQAGVEACDDMNTEDGDECPADCMLGGETTSSGGDDTTAGESDTIADTSGGSDTDVTATGSMTSATTTATATGATATSANGGSDTDDGESEGGADEDDASSGCSCATNDTVSGWGLLGLFGVAVARRRHARRVKCRAEARAVSRDGARRTRAVPATSC
jgi:MYXO-CTERM domain-containing protein